MIVERNTRDADFARSGAVAAREARHLVHVFPTFVVGGVQNRIIRIAKALRQKYRHTVISLDGNFEAATGLEGDTAFAFEFIPIVKTPFISVRNLLRARRALHRLRPDLLLTYNWGSLEWALANRMLVGSRHIHFESGFGPDELPQRQLWRRAKTRRILLSRCEQIVVPSRVLHDLATRVWGFPLDKVRYVPNGIDCGRFATAPDEAFATALGISRHTLVVGTVAALRKEKNLLRLVRVFAALPTDLDARLVIVGGGPEHAALAQAATELKVADRVIFAGALADPERILRRFDVFALTSDTEQMPNSVLEAMAAGLAVAATDVGDVRRMLSPENAEFVVPVDDDAGFTDRLRRLLQDRDLRALVGRSNEFRAVKEFALEAMVERYDALFSGVY